jgi:hypothetical protein
MDLVLLEMVGGKSSYTMDNFVKKLNVEISRKSLQGGASNEEFPPEYYWDYRFMHHHYTPIATKWQGFKRTEHDTKFHDAVSGTMKAEGKALNPNSGVCFAPSINVGGGRTPTRENIEKCFETNNYYFLYTTLNYEDEKVIAVIYWIPTTLIRSWFAQHGRRDGKICYSKFMDCMREATVVEEPEIMRRGFDLV